jgi:nucleotide-binding universal stress UspA family protein
MYKRIMVTTDGSELSNKAVNTALELAKICGAEVFALKVVPRYPQSLFEGAISVDTAEVQTVEKRWAADAENILATVKKAAADIGVATQTLLGKSDTVCDGILSEAKKHDCDLIVMASHGRRGLQKLLLGSETQHVLTQSSIPVLVVK